MPADVEVGVPRADRGARRLRLSLPRAMLVAIATYGAVGLILAFVLLAGLLRLATTAGGLAHEQDSLVQVTQSSRAAALDGQAAAQRAEAGVTATADAADRAAGFVRELATALRETADSLRVDVFGSQPFAAAADRVAGAADQADQTSTGLSEAANQARAGATQLHAVTADLGRIADDLDAVAHGLSAGGGLDDASLAVLEIALVGLLAWLAVPAGVCVWLGFTLWRRPAVRPRSAPRRAPVR